jgi:hypothetical protein
MDMTPQMGVYDWGMEQAMLSLGITFLALVFALVFSVAVFVVYADIVRHRFK